MRAKGRLIGGGFLLGTAMVGFAAFAQEIEEDFEPAVDTSAMFDETAEFEPAVNTSAEPPDVLEPAASSAAIAQDVTRRESSSGVMDEIMLGRTEITGNQELPKVLYIVPWKKADPGDMTGRPVNTLIDDVLAPLDREEFIRQVDYYDDLHGD